MILITVIMTGQGIRRFEARETSADELRQIGGRGYMFEDDGQGFIMVLPVYHEMDEVTAQGIVEQYQRQPFLRIVDWSLYNALVTPEVREQYPRRSAQVLKARHVRKQNEGD